jgi:hypothetical protein
VPKELEPTQNESNRNIKGDTEIQQFGRRNSVMSEETMTIPADLDGLGRGN